MRQKNNKSKINKEINKRNYVRCKYRMSSYVRTVKIIEKKIAKTKTKRETSPTTTTTTNNEEVMLVGILICNHIYGEEWSFAIHLKYVFNSSEFGIQKIVGFLKLKVFLFCLRWVDYIA